MEFDMNAMPRGGPGTSDVLFTKTLLVSISACFTRFERQSGSSKEYGQHMRLDPRADKTCGDKEGLQMRELPPPRVTLFGRFSQDAP
jgi:hypothetical protein